MTTRIGDRHEFGRKPFKIGFHQGGVAPIHTLAAMSIKSRRHEYEVRLKANELGQHMILKGLAPGMTRGRGIFNILESDIDNIVMIMTFYFFFFFFFFAIIRRRRRRRSFRCWISCGPIRVYMKFIWSLYGVHMEFILLFILLFISVHTSWRSRSLTLIQDKTTDHDLWYRPDSTYDRPYSTHSCLALDFLEHHNHAPRQRKHSQHLFH